MAFLNYLKSFFPKKKKIRRKTKKQIKNSNDKSASYISKQMKEMVNRTLSIFFVLLVGTLIILLSSQAPDIHETWLQNKLAGSVVMLTPTTTSLTGGTGFAVQTADGLRILSNAHVCKGIKKMSKYAAAHHESLQGGVAILKILRISNRYDLCLLSGIRGLTPLKIASKSPKFGQRAFVLGHPYLSPQTLSIGRIRGKSVIEVGSIISGEQEYKDCKDSGGRIRNYVFFEACIYEQSALDTTIEIYPGNSGSPVVDSYGRLISVVFAGNSATNDGFLVPYEFLEDFLSGDLG